MKLSERMNLANNITKLTIRVHSQRLRRWADEAAKLEAENKWMRREIERAGYALFTGTKTGDYVGTEEDLHSIGSFVEGVCETNERLMNVEAKNFAARAIMQKFVDKVDRGMARSIETYTEMKQ